MRARLQELAVARCTTLSPLLLLARPQKLYKHMIAEKES